jgi:imidazolonepropionase-like amidohydrolase
LVTDTTDTRTLERFYLPAKGIADLDFNSKPVQEFIATLAKNQVAIDPTLATFDFIRHRAGEMSAVYGSVAAHMPPDVQRGLRAAEFDIPDDETAARYNKSYDKMVDFVGRMYRAGVPILAGTDALAGFTLHSELELYVKAGLTPAQVLQVATWNGAKYSRTLEDRGSIAVGKRADLILVDGDPTKNISDIRNIALVIKNGTAYAPSEVYEALGIKPFVPAVPIQTRR